MTQYSLFTLHFDVVLDLVIISSSISSVLSERSDLARSVNVVNLIFHQFRESAKSESLNGL